MDGNAMNNTDYQGRKLDHISDLARIGRTAQYSLLIVCLYVVLTLSEMTHAALFLNTVDTPLPIIGVKVNIQSFNFFAPLILIAIYTYFHSIQIRLWLEVNALWEAGLDSVLKYVFPWQFFEVGIMLKGEKPDSPFIYMMRFVSVILAWGVVPLLCLAIIWYALPARSISATAWNIGIFAISVFMSVYSIWLTQNLTKNKNTPRNNKKALLGSLISTIALTCVVGVSAFSLWHPATFNSGIASLNLMRVELSEKPKEWEEFNPIIKTPNSKNRIDVWRQQTNRVTESIIENRLMPSANLVGVFAIKTVIKNTNLDYSHLTGANFSKARFSDVSLQYVNFRNTMLLSTQFTRSNLRGAKFIGSYAQGTQFLASDMSKAEFIGGALGGASFGGAILNGATFRKPESTSEQAMAKAARLSMRDVNFTSVIMKYDGKPFRMPTTLMGADLSGADLSLANFSYACIDENTKLPTDEKKRPKDEIPHCKDVLPEWPMDANKLEI